MLRKSLAMLVAVAVTAFTGTPVALAQYPQQSYPQQSYPQQSYPQQQYPQTQNQTGQYGAPDSGQGGQYAGQQGNDAEDQQHGVARLSIAQGDVNVKRGDNGELTVAVVNAPLMTQDTLQVGGGSRAEVELDYANVLRLAPNTQLIVADLQYHRARMQLGMGTLILRVLRESDAQIEVDTPSIGFQPRGQGEYRVSVLEDGTTQITTRSGPAQMFGPRGSQDLAAGQTILVRGNASDPEYQSTYALGRDQFDDWSQHRDEELLRSQSYRYVSRDIYGADDLDHYGNWVPSQYGQVWTPQGQSADWSPYSTGQWVWQNYYGWSWVDTAPWGWAPYHYGRWFMNGGYGWCWWPGAIRSSYFWNPAVVGFFGWGGFGVGLALGGLGWVALAPFELFHSWWGHGWGGGYGYDRFRAYGNYGRGDIGRMYRNAAYRGGAMTAGYNGFGGPHQRFSPATRGQLTNANSFRGGIPVGPTRASYQFSSRQAVSNGRFASASNRQFFQSSRSQAGHASNFGGNYGAARSQSFAGNSGRASAANSGGWQRFGDPGHSSALQHSFTGGFSERSGWHSFGQSQPAAGARSFSSPHYNAPGYGSSGQRYSAPNYSGGNYSGGSYSGGNNQRYGSSSYGGGQRYSAPAYSGNQHYSAPSYGASSGGQHYSAPRNSGGSQHYSAPSNGGGGHSSSGGSSHGGGGGGGHSGGGGGHHR